MSTGWQFPHNGGGSAQGFSDGAIDTFSGRRLSSLVREVIQNSLDAVDRSKGAPVKVIFSLEHVPKSQLEDLIELKSHLSKCSEMAQLQKLTNAQDFHDKAISLIEKTDLVPVLAISDANTKGLHGPIDQEYGPWFALTKGTGITQKPGEGSLGSFGHGSKAPFAMGSLRTLYYLTSTVNPNQEREIRFQGKSILQSHKHPDTNETTQGIGFFGHKSTLAPLLNKEAPDWAVSIRNKHIDDPSDLGTTLLIPHTRFRDDLFPETKITVVANFFYAIKERNLVVVVDGEEINHTNVEDKFRWCIQVIEDEKDEIDHEHIKECFKSIESIINPTHTGKENIDNFGSIVWYLRVSDDLNYKAVAISRQSGMLITRKPPRLERFPNKKNFDMFVFVDKGKGSDSLKRLENPAHDNFEFDRVQDASDADSIKTAYDKLQKTIRSILDEHAAIEVTDEVQLTELAQLMFDLSSTEEKNENSERGKTMYISSKAIKKRSISNQGRAGAAGSYATTGQHHGENTGSGKGKGTKGNKPGEGLKEVDVTGGSENVTQGSSKIRAEKLRVCSVPGQPKLAKIFFTVSEIGSYTFQLQKVGEDENEVIKLIVDNNKPVSALNMVFNEPGRQTHTVELENPTDLDFAMEAWIDVAR